MKLAGVLLIITACSLSGQYFSQLLSARVKFLERIQIMLSSIKTCLEFSAAPVDSLLDTLCGKVELSPLKFIPACRDLYKDGVPFPEAWKAAFENRLNTGPLKPEDISLLLSFGGVMGTTGLNGQISSCELHERLLEENLTAAREIKAKYGKVYTTMGILAGILLSILII